MNIFRGIVRSKWLIVLLLVGAAVSSLFFVYIQIWGAQDGAATIYHPPFGIEYRYGGEEYGYSWPKNTVFRPFGVFDIAFMSFYSWAPFFWVPILALATIHLLLRFSEKSKSMLLIKSCNILSIIIAIIFVFFVFLALYPYGRIAYNLLHPYQPPQALKAQMLP